MRLNKHCCLFIRKNKGEVSKKCAEVKRYENSRKREDNRDKGRPESARQLQRPRDGMQAPGVKKFLASMELQAKDPQAFCT